MGKKACVDFGFSNWNDEYFGMIFLPALPTSSALESLAATRGDKFQQLLMAQQFRHGEARGCAPVEKLYYVEPVPKVRLPTATARG